MNAIRISRVENGVLQYRCNLCHKWKDFDEFVIRRLPYSSGKCYRCRKILAKKRYHATKRRVSWSVHVARSLEYLSHVDVYAKGFDSANIRDNPYEPGTISWYVWREGFLQKTVIEPFAFLRNENEYSFGDCGQRILRDRNVNKNLERRVAFEIRLNETDEENFDAYS